MLFFLSAKGWNLPTKETKLMASRIRIDLTSITEVLFLHPPKVPEKSLCPKLLRSKKYSAALSVRWMDFSLLLSNASDSEPCSWLNCSLSEKSRWEGINTLQHLQHGSEPWREFISTNCLPKASLLSKHNRWIHKFQIYVPSHLWAGDQLQWSCKRLNNNHCGS